jgi:hypothetical protein
MQTTPLNIVLQSIRVNTDEIRKEEFQFLMSFSFHG